MKKNLGIAAVAIDIVALFVPAMGAWLTVSAIFLSALAFKNSEFGVEITGILVDITDALVAVPLLWVSPMLAGMGVHHAKTLAMAAPWVLIGIQITVCIGLMV